MQTGQQSDTARPADYLASERTYLAWVRTAVAIMALGFVVVKFGLLTRELAGTLHTTPSPLAAPIGVALVLLGGLLTIAARSRLSAAEHDIAAGIYRPQPFLTNVLALGIALSAVLLAVYLISSN